MCLWCYNTSVRKITAIIRPLETFARRSDTTGLPNGWVYDGYNHERYLDKETHKADFGSLNNGWIFYLADETDWITCRLTGVMVLPEERKEGPGQVEMS